MKKFILVFTLILSSCAGMAPAPVGPPPKVEDITKLVEGSDCAKYSWQQRGRAPEAYLKGVMIGYARALCNKEGEDIKVVAQAPQLGAQVPGDALSHYQVKAESGVESIRKTYSLLIGLGMRESSGKHCEGRDASATNTSADTAEAGLFQTSYNSRVKHSVLPKIYSKFKADKSKCFLSVFSSRVSCPKGSEKNWGSGEGVTFQELSKTCPMFALEYAAVMIRVNGGPTGHYGPLRNKAAGMLPACERLLVEVEKTVAAKKEICNTIL